MNILQNILAVIVLLGVLITFHEFGHFLVARLCGVRVLRFSVGFGKALWRRQSRSGTEFMIAAIPLGGYVKMLDEREGPVPEQWRQEAFNQKNVYLRILIVLAGPFANFLLAILAYWFLFVMGISAVVPVVGEVLADSPAAVAQLPVQSEITAINQTPTRSWQEVALVLLSHIGFSGNLSIQTADHKTYVLPVNDFMAGQDPPQPLQSLGVLPWQPMIPAVIGQVLPNSPASRANLQVGDKILSINDQSVKDWPMLIKLMAEQNAKQWRLELLSPDGQLRSVELTPAIENGESTAHPKMGIAAQAVVWPKQALRDIRYSVADGLVQAFARSWQMTSLTLKSMGKMLTGSISVHNLSGPVSIARIAGDSARSGLESFISFLAYLSLSLGIINLLPIPVLDGGHLLYFVIEAIRGRPLSEQLQQQGLKIGLVIVVTLMIMAFYFDLVKL